MLVLNRGIQISGVYRTWIISQDDASLMGTLAPNISCNSRKWGHVWTTLSKEIIFILPNWKENYLSGTKDIRPQVKVQYERERKRMQTQCYWFLSDSICRVKSKLPSSVMVCLCLHLERFSRWRNRFQKLEGIIQRKIKVITDWYIGW